MSKTFAYSYESQSKQKMLAFFVDLTEYGGQISKILANSYKRQTGKKYPYFISLKIFKVYVLTCNFGKIIHLSVIGLSVKTFHFGKLIHT